MSECLPVYGEVERRKFVDPLWTVKGERRAVVPFSGLATLWFNTGTLCNIACTDCYIESTPKNDSLVYLKRDEVAAFLHQAASLSQRPQQVGFTGGEPFMNPDIIPMLSISLAAGFEVLVLTNAMRPMQRHGDALIAVYRRYPGRLSLRVSIDHYVAEKHEHVRGPRTWAPALEGIRWLASNGFALSIAGRQAEGETDGFLQAVVDKRGRVLGATIVGAHAGEFILPWVLAISQRLKIGALASVIAPYPTLSEVTKRAAGSFYTPKLFSPRTRAIVRFLGAFG